MKAIGEGTRERKKSVYGPGGRSVGGEARRAQLRTVTPPKEDKPPPKKVTFRLPPKKAPVVMAPPADDDDMPEPGGHPKDLKAVAEANGRKVPTNPLAALAAQAARLAAISEQGAVQMPEGARQAVPESTDFLAEGFKPKRAIDRPTRTREEELEGLKKLRFKLPILRTQRVIEYAPEPEPELDPATEINALEMGAVLEEKKEEPEKQLMLFEVGPPAPIEKKTAEEEGRVIRRKPPVVEEIPAGITKYNERQTYEVARLMGGIPGVVCDNCPIAERCEHVKENATCVYDEDLNGLTSRDLDNVVPTLEMIADLQKQRAMRAVMHEARSSGGQLDVRVTRQLEVAAMAVERVATWKQPQQQAATRSIIVTQQGGAQPQGGLLQRLMSGIAGNLPAAQNSELPLHEPVTTIEVKETVPMSTNPDLPLGSFEERPDALMPYVRTVEAPQESTPTDTIPLAPCENPANVNARGTNHGNASEGTGGTEEYRT